MTAIHTIDDLCDYMTARGMSYTRDGNMISKRGSLNLSALTTLPEGVTLSAGGWLYLSSLTTLPEGVTLSAGGWLDLCMLTTLPEGVTLSAGRWLYLSSLTDEIQTYQGREIRLRTIDNICTRLIRKRTRGDVTIWSAQYFKGHLDTDKRCYVAQIGGDYAHGDTAEKAVRDLRFKIMQRDMDVDDLVAEIATRGVITFDEYRLLTGACESGLTEGLRTFGKAGAVEMPLSEALRLSRGHYGGDRLAELFAEEADA